MVAVILAAIFPLDILADLVSIGTLVAFIAVCAGVMILRRDCTACATAVSDAMGVACRAAGRAQLWIDDVQPLRRDLAAARAVERNWPRDLFCLWPPSRAGVEMARSA